MQKIWSWAVTGYNFPHKMHDEIIELCRYAGISSVEGNSSFVEGKSGQELEEIREQYEKAGMSLESFHLPMGADDDIACFYETRRRQVVELMAEFFEKASLLGSRTVILHPSSSRFNVEDEGMERYLSQMGKSLDVLIPKAENLGLIIALENILPGEGGYRLGSNPEHFTLFTQNFGHPHLSFCLDTGHALVAGGPEGPASFFEAMSENLAAFHLQDNAGDRDSHLAPGYGLVDWNVIFGGMVRIKFAYSACIEAPPFAYGPNHTYSFDAWKKMIEETDELVQNSINPPARPVNR